MSKIGVTCHVIGKGRAGEDLSVWVHRKGDGKVTIALGPTQEHSAVMDAREILEAVGLCGNVALAMGATE